MRAAFLFTIASTSLAVACGGGGNNDCTPGASIACTCTSGQTGAQVCQDDGTLAACMCTGAPDAAPPDAEQPSRTFQFTGHVTLVDDPQGILGITTGDTFTGSYTYEVAANDGNADPTVGDYTFQTTGDGMHVAINGITYETDPTATDLDFIEVVDRPTNSGGDHYQVLSNHNRTSGTRYVQELSWQLDDSDGTAYSSDALPTTAPVLSDFTQTFGFRIEACATVPTGDCSDEASDTTIGGVVDTVGP